MGAHGWFFMLVLVWFSSISVPAASASTVKNVVMIVDGSGSMNDVFENRSKLDTAKAALGELVRDMPGQQLNAGLVVYSGGCESSTTTVPLGRLDRDALLSGVGRIVASGKTPLAASLRLAQNQLAKVPGEKTVILLTDGKETCGGDPRQSARELYRSGIKVFVVGFDIPEVEAARGLQTLAQSGGGAYFTATTTDGLTVALGQAAEAADKGKVPTFPRVQENIQIIVDASSDMVAPYQGQTRLAIAQSALKDVLDRQHPDRDNISLRSIGGECGLFLPEPIVPFGLNNGPPIMQQVDALQPRGKRTLVDVVLAAIDDFNKPVFEGVSRRVLLLVGGGDSCLRPQSTQLIRERFADAKIKAKFSFIGIGLDQQAMSQLVPLANAAGDQYPSNYLTEQDLSRALFQHLEFQPAIDNVRSIVRVLDGSIKLLDEATNLINEKKYGEAEAKIREAERLRVSTLKPYEDLARRRINESFANIFSVAQKMRQHQGQMTGIELETVEQAKKLDAAKAVFDAQKQQHSQALDVYNKALEIYNNSVNAYNLVFDETKAVYNKSRGATNEYNRLVGEANGVVQKLKP